MKSVFLKPLNVIKKSNYIYYGIVIIMTIMTTPAAKAGELKARNYQQLMTAIARAEAFGRACKIYLEGSIELQAPLELRKHTLIGRNRDSHRIRNKPNCILLDQHEWQQVETGFEISPGKWGTPQPSDTSHLKKLPYLYPAPSFEGEALLILYDQASLKSVIIDFPQPASAATLKGIQCDSNTESAKQDSLEDCYWTTDREPEPRRRSSVSKSLKKTASDDTNILDLMLVNVRQKLSGLENERLNERLEERIDELLSESALTLQQAEKMSKQKTQQRTLEHRLSMQELPNHSIAPDDDLPTPPSPLGQRPRCQSLQVIPSTATRGMARSGHSEYPPFRLYTIEASPLVTRRQSSDPGNSSPEQSEGSQGHCHTRSASDSDEVRTTEWSLTKRQSQSDNALTESAGLGKPLRLRLKSQTSWSPDNEPLETIIDMSPTKPAGKSEFTFSSPPTAGLPSKRSRGHQRTTSEHHISGSHLILPPWNAQRRQSTGNPGFQHVENKPIETML